MQGVPYFLINGTLALSGAMEPSAFLRRLRAGQRLHPMAKGAYARSGREESRHVEREQHGPEGGRGRRSLGGLFNAIALLSLDARSTSSRSRRGLMKDRGAGIVFQQEVAAFLTPLRNRPAGGRRRPRPEPSLPRSGRLGGARRADAPGDDFVGHTVTGNSVTFFGDDPLPRWRPAGRCSRRANDKVDGPVRGTGGKKPCDLLVGADGPSSTVAGTTPALGGAEYAGYVAWRGVVLERQAPNLAAEFADRFTFFQPRHP